MTYPVSQNAYAIAVGASTENKVVLASRDPSINDISYQILQFWYNTSTFSLWVLLRLSSSAGVVTATWAEIIAGGITIELAADSGVAVPSGGVINVIGGTGISTVASGNTLTISSTGSVFTTITTVNHAMSPYTVLVTDEFLAVDSTAGVVSILLPNTTSTGREISIKDSKGQSATNNITVTTVGGAVTIDGSTSYVIKTNYESIEVIFDGTSYEVS